MRACRRSFSADNHLYTSGQRKSSLLKDEQSWLIGSKYRGKPWKHAPPPESWQDIDPPSSATPAEALQAMNLALAKNRDVERGWHAMTHAYRGWFLGRVPMFWAELGGGTISGPGTAIH